MRESPPRLGRVWLPVLSIGVMKAAGWEYYAREVACGLEDYYTGAGETPGVWSGRGARIASSPPGASLAAPGPCSDLISVDLGVSPRFWRARSLL